MTQEDDYNFDSYGVPEFFCETLGKIEQVGPCRRLFFVIHETTNGRRGRAGVFKVVLPAEALAEIAQMLAADIHTPKVMASLSPNALAN